MYGLASGRGKSGLRRVGWRVIPVRYSRRAELAAERQQSLGTKQGGNASAVGVLHEGEGEE